MGGQGRRTCLSAVLSACVLLLGPPARAANPVGGLLIDPIVGYNLVVDSNMDTPAGRSPSAAYLGVKFCNTNNYAISNVVAYIGDFAAGTPGFYPVTMTNKPGPGLSPFSLTHEAGHGTNSAADDQLKRDDARRVIGTIGPYECRVEYWLVSYPLLDSGGSPVHAPSVKPYDDLILYYDIWAESQHGATISTAAVSRQVTCRNEITAMANKIQPNNANKVPQEYLDLLEQYWPEWTNTAYDGTVGTRIIVEGYWYDLGVINQGFDNDGDLVPDYNAWMQPVGNPGSFDASCFRLVKTRAMVVLKGVTVGTNVYIVEDQLYFEHMPENSGAIGLVLYEFMPMRPNCYSVLTPYQEVASGFDNEKFNADYGAGMGFLSSTSSLTVDKVGNVTVIPGTNIYYSIAFTNLGHHTTGGIVINDSIPDGTHYIAGSATNFSTLPPNVKAYIVFYSTNNGATWTEAEPSNPTNVTDVQWWLSDDLGSNAYGSIGFGVQVPVNFSNDSPYICNTACIQIDGVYDVICDEICTEVRGSNALGDTVWADDGSGGGYVANQVQEAGEPGITGITVRLYRDSNTNRAWDSGDTYIRSMSTGANGYYLFTNLLDGMYVAVVDWLDPDLPYGYTLTTPESHWADLDYVRTNPVAVVYTNADFGFAPALILDKALVGSSNVYEGRLVSFDLTVTNNLPGDGTATGGGSATYTVWCTNLDVVNSGSKANELWTNIPCSYTPAHPDGNWAFDNLNNVKEILACCGMNLGTRAGLVTNVQLVFITRTNGNTACDTTIDLIKNGVVFWTFATNNTFFKNGESVLDVTSVSNWTWQDFSTTNLSWRITDKKQGNPGGQIMLDVGGFRIMSDRSSAGGTDSTTLNPVPLTDSYPTNVLRYYSANPSPSLVTNYGGYFGTLWWDNIGPIYPGGASTVRVTFTTLEPPTNQALTVTNYCWVTNATFVNGVPANTATDQAPVLMRPAGTIGDYIWRDSNGNGVQDDGASNVVGIANVRVVLYPPTNIDIGAGIDVPITNVTDRNGWYLFTGLPATGRYTVVVLTNTLPGSFTNTYDEDGVLNSRTIVSNMIPTSTTFSLQNHLTADFGYRLGQALDGTVWHDVNRSGTPPPPDAGEEWITGVVVRLYYSTNLTTAIATNRTDANGYFIFYNLQANTYTVIVSTNEGALASGTWHQSYDTDGTGTAHQVTATVPAGGVGHADYSYYRGGYEFGDEVFWDWDGDGVRDANEEGIPNISVYAYEDANTNGVVNVGTDAYFGAQSTSITGYYLFAAMPPTGILVYVDESDPDFPDRVICTADPDGVFDGRNVFSITTSNDYRRDFGYQPYGYGAIGDFVWHDVDGDAAQDMGEPGIPDISVWLYVDADGDGNYVLRSSNSTDSSGWYIFTNLPDMDYRVIVDTGDPDLLTDDLGHTAQPTTVTSHDITIAGNSTNLTADFGFVLPGILGDTVFWDYNESGSQDWNEPGIDGVTVGLYIDEDHNRVYNAGTDTHLSNTVTDADGVYHFTGLWPSNYIVVVDTLSTPITNAVLSADPDNDGLPCSDPAATNCDSAYAYVLDFEEVFLGADFGYIPPGVIGDLVWVDQSDNGIRDNGEPGIPWVTVNLWSGGVVVDTTETDPDGWYYFGNLMDGVYEVTVDTGDADFPADLYAVYDYDGTPYSLTTNIVIQNGVVTNIGGTGCTDCNLDVDFGYRYPGNNILSGTIGLDKVPFDGLMGTNAYGVSPGEAPFPGVMVYLKLWDDDGDDVVESGEWVDIYSTSTDTNGDYSFTNLPEGDGDDRWIVSMAAPQEHLILTTETGDTPAEWVSNTVNAAGESRSAFQVVTIQPVTTNIDFAFTWTIDYDFGDLPESYSTVVNNLPAGPQNRVLGSTNLYLGAGVDTENNGQPTTDATGDGADEDGVALPYQIWQDGTGKGRVSVVVGKGGGWLTGYIDFDGDGTFMQFGEMVANQAVTVGTYSVSFDIPAGTIQPTNTTVLYARFRLFPSQPFIPELSFARTVNNGEVEDYRWLFGALGETVWEDANSNNTWEGFEPLFTNVIVFVDLNTNLVRDADEPYTVTGTNAVTGTNTAPGTWGRYWIGGFPPGTFNIRVDSNTLPTNEEYYATYDLDGGTDNVAAVTMGSGDVNINVDFGYRSKNSTYVLLSSFQASAADGDVVLEWETAAEMGTAGFNILRWEPGSAEFVQVNDRLLPALVDSPQGGSYRFIDPSAKRGRTYHYQLNEVEFEGRVNAYGPAIVVVPKEAGAKAETARKERSLAERLTRTPRVSELTEERLARSRSEAAKFAAARKADVSVTRAVARHGTPEWPAIKVRVSKSGVYYVDSATLAGLVGSWAAAVNARISSGLLRVSNRGLVCDYVPVTGGFYFYGEAVGGRYATNNVYWLTWDGGTHASVLAGTPPSPAGGGTFADTLHVEKDAFAVTAPIKDPSEDFWLWEYLYAGFVPYDQKGFAAYPASLAAGGGTATLVSHLFGSTATRTPQEHRVQISVNGTLLGETAWDGIRFMDITNTFDQSLLVAGSNAVTVKAVLGAGVPYSIVYVNSFDLTYHRRYEAVGNQALVRGDGNAVITVTGFTSPDIRVLDVSDPRKPIVQEGVAVEAFGGGYRASFTPAGPSVPYQLFATGAGLPAVSVAADAASNLRSAGNEGEYLLVTVPELAAAAGLLAGYRDTQWKTKVVLLEDIYDEFNYGVAEIPCLRDFLAYAVQNWAAPPRYVVLVGEGTYDYRDCKGAGDSKVPAMMASTPHGIFASDGWFTDFDGDLVPDVAIGRLPALTAEEVSSLVNRIIRYETGEGGRWRQDVVLAADNPDNGGDFDAASEEVLGLMPVDYAVEKVYLSQHPVNEAKALLTNAMNRGAGLVNYFGHGGLDTMATEGLLKSSHAASLTNSARLPLVVSLSCAIGQFAAPAYDCLGEVLMISRGGAAAVWSPSGQSYNRGAIVLADLFYRAVFREGESILGDAMLSAMGGFNETGRRYMLSIYNLLGDPAMRLEGAAFAPGGSTMEGWEGVVFSESELEDTGYSAFDADPDGDLVVNLMEYAMGWNPHVADGDPRIRILGPWQVEFGPGGEASVVFRRRKSAGDVEFTLQSSRDLTNWSSADAYVTETEVTDDGNGLTETVRVTLSVPDSGSGGPLCIRLRVRKP